MLNLIFAVALVSFLSLSETTVPQGTQPLRIEITPNMGPNFDFGFSPRVSKFATSDRIAGWDKMDQGERIKAMTNLARCYANSWWNEQSYVDQAGFIEESYITLMKEHRKGLSETDQSYNFSSRILTCKAFKESAFNMQIGNFYGSSAIGFAQIVDGTLEDLLSTRVNFRSRIPGYEHISSADEIRREMAKNPMLQLEMGLGVLEMKRVDHKLSGENIKPILEGYLSSSDSNNQDYADSIYACANCVKNNNFSFSLKCLCDAKPDDDKCIDTASGGIPKCTK